MKNDIVNYNSKMLLKMGVIFVGKKVKLNIFYRDLWWYHEYLICVSLSWALILYMQSLLGDRDDVINWIFVLKELFITTIFMLSFYLHYIV